MKHDIMQSGHWGEFNGQKEKSPDALLRSLSIAKTKDKIF